MLSLLGETKMKASIEWTFFLRGETNGILFTLLIPNISSSQHVSGRDPVQVPPAMEKFQISALDSLLKIVDTLAVPCCTKKSNGGFPVNQIKMDLLVFSTARKPQLGGFLNLIYPSRLYIHSPSFCGSAQRKVWYSMNFNQFNFGNITQKSPADNSYPIERKRTTYP